MSKISELIKKDRKNFKKNKKNYLPNEFVEKLYENPSEFFSTFQEDIEKLKSENNSFIDSQGISIFEHFINLYYFKENENENNQIYKDNFELFFSQLIDKYNIGKNGSFLFILSKRNKNDLFLDLCNKLFEKNLLTKEMLETKNENDERCFDKILYDIKVNYSRIENNQEEFEKYVQFFNNLLNIVDLDEKEKNEIYKFISKINLDKKNLSLIKEDELKKQIESIFEINNEKLTISLIYDSILNFNLITYVFRKNYLDLYNYMIEKISNFNDKQIIFIPLIEHLFYLLEKGDNLEYIKNLISILSNLIEENKKNLINKFSKRNTFHFLYSNKNLNNKEKYEMTSELNSILYKNNNELIKKLFNQKDNNQFYPFMILLLNSKYDDDLKLLFEYIKTFIKIDDNKNYEKIIIFSHYLLFFIGKENINIFSLLFNYLKEENLLNLLYVNIYYPKSVFKLLSQEKFLPKEIFIIIFQYLNENLDYFSEKKYFKLLLNFLIVNIKFLNDENFIKILDFISNNINHNLKYEVQKNNENNIKKFNDINLKNKNEFFELLNMNNLIEIFNNYSKLNEEIEIDLIFILIQKLLNIIFENSKNFEIEKLENIYLKFINFLPENYLLKTIFKLCLTIEKQNNNLLFNIISKNIELIYNKLNLKSEKNIFSLIFTIFEIQNLFLENKNSKFCLKFYLHFIAAIDHSNNFKAHFQILIFNILTDKNLIKDINQLNIKSEIPALNNINATFKKMFPKFSNVQFNNNVKITLISSLIKTNILYEIFEKFLLILNKDEFNDYYEILVDLSKIRKTTLFKSDLLSKSNKFYNSIKTSIKNILSKLYLIILNYVKCKFPNNFIYCYFLIKKMCKPIKNEKLFCNEIEKNVLTFNKINKMLLSNTNSNLTLEKKNIFIQNFILNFKNKEINTNDNNNNIIENQKLNEIIKFIKDNYQKENFFDLLIQNKNIYTYIYNNYNKNYNDYIMNEFITINIKYNLENKQKIISYFNPNYIINLNNPSNLIFDENDFAISFNPFTFLLYKKSFSNEEIELYSAFLANILQDKRIQVLGKEHRSKYIQFNIELMNDLKKFKNFDIFFTFFKNLNNFFEFNKPIIENVYNNISFIDCIGYIIHNLLNNFINNKTKLEKCNEFLKMFFTNFKYVFNVLKNNENFLVTLLNFIEINLYNITKDVEVLNLIQENLFNLNFFNNLAEIKIEITIYQNIITKIICILLLFSDISILDSVLKNIISTKNLNKIKTLLNSFNKKNFLCEFYILYAIKNNDLDLFKKIFNLLNIAPPAGKGKDLLLDKIEINEYYEYIYIKKRKNELTKHIFIYHETIFFYYCLICSSDDILEYINENYVNMNDIKEIYKPSFYLNYNLKKSIFCSKNLNYILEFYEILNFDDFNDNDYYLICQFFNDEKYFDSYIKAFSSLLVKYSFIKLFIACILYDNIKLGKFIFNNFVIEEKEQLLNEEINIENNKENILHLLVIKNHYYFLKELLNIIKLKPKNYIHLLLEYLPDEKEYNFNMTEFINNYDKNNINENDIQIFKTFKTPLYYSILNNSYECFVLLYDFYPKIYISEVFSHIENTSKLNTKISYSISLIEKYINYFKIEENKILLKMKILIYLNLVKNYYLLLKY